MVEGFADQRKEGVVMGFLRIHLFGCFHLWFYEIRSGLIRGILVVIWV